MFGSFNLPLLAQAKTAFTGSDAMTADEENNVFSSSPEFLRVTGWNRSGSRLLPNIYEEVLSRSDLETPQKHFKKLFQLYQTDQNFRCRFPITNLYFEKMFGRIIPDTELCKPWEQIEFYDFIPQRVHSVSVVWVDSGSEVLSRFGHLALGFNFLPDRHGSIEDKPDEFSAIINISASLTGKTVIHGNELDTELRSKIEKIKTDGTPWTATIMFKSLMGTNPLQISFQDKQSFLDEKAQEDRNFHILELKLTEVEKRALLIAINRAMTHSSHFDYSLFTNGCSTIIADLLSRIHFTQTEIDGLLPSSVFENISNRQTENLQYPPQFL
jgi:hypothetical protein